MLVADDGADCDVSRIPAGFSGHLLFERRSLLGYLRLTFPRMVVPKRLWGTCDRALGAWKITVSCGINIHALQQARDGAHHTFVDGKWVFTRFFVC